MGQRPVKRSLRGSDTLKKKSKSLEDGKRDSELASCYSLEDMLTSLPNEIILHIFSYLSPIDLSTLSKLNNERLTELTYTIKEANFSSSQTYNNVQLVKSFFTRIRVRCIQKLNFNYYCYMSPCELEMLISRCKNLSTLSVIESGLTSKNIIRILKKCTKLEKLAWSINYDSWEEDDNLNCICMKQVYLFSDRIVVLSEIVFAFAKNFPHLENMWICSFCGNMSAFPFIGLMSRSLFMYSRELRRHFSLIVNYAPFLPDLDEMEANFVDQLKQLGFQNQSDLIRSRTYNNPPFLHFRSTSEDISLLSSGPFNAFSTMAIILTSDIVDVSESLIKCVEKVAGKNLKNFALQHLVSDFTPSYYPDVIKIEESLAACELLTKIFLSSKNITNLNLTTVHFCAGSPVKAITQLPSLKTLNIPSCAFGKSCTLVNSEVFNLSDIVSNCPKVENFTLYCCIYTSPLITEEDVICMSNWSLLKHLSIYFAVLRSSNFLQKVADSCVDLLSFSLISVSPGRHCDYMNDVIYILKNSKRLSFIRINDEIFDPKQTGFWRAIGEAANLEGICIMTDFLTKAERNFFLEETKKLKYLKLLHFSEFDLNKELDTEIRKSRKAHGVKNVRIEQDCETYDPYHPRVVNQHHPGSLSCQSLHFQDIDIF